MTKRENPYKVLCMLPGYSHNKKKKQKTHLLSTYYVLGGILGNFHVISRNIYNGLWRKAL